MAPSCLAPTSPLASVTGISGLSMAAALSRLKSRRFRRLGREFLWIGIGQAVATAGALVGVRLLTEALSPEVYGELALGMTLSTLVNKTVLGPLSSAALRFFSPAREADEFFPFLKALTRWVGRGTGIIVLLALMMTVALFWVGNFNWLWLGIATTAFALLSGYDSILSGLQSAARQRAIVAWHQALVSWGRFLIAVGLTVWLGATSYIAMTGYVIASLFTLLSQFWFFNRTLSPEGMDFRQDQNIPDWETRMFTYAWPFATWGVFTWAQGASDRWALQVFTTTGEVGLYAVLYQLGYYPVTILTSLVTNLVAPIFFQRAGDGTDPERLLRIRNLNWFLTIGALLLTVCLTLLAVLFHEAIFGLLVAPDYRSVSWLLPGMIFASGLFASGQFASIDLMSNVKSRTLLTPKITTAAIGVTMNVLGAVAFGITGIVVASIVFSLSHFIWVTLLVNRNVTGGNSTF
jgi:O-antigen/teichoic acid export membrane protein